MDQVHDGLHYLEIMKYWIASSWRRQQKPRRCNKTLTVTLDVTTESWSCMTSWVLAKNYMKTSTMLSIRRTCTTLHRVPCLLENLSLDIIRRLTRNVLRLGVHRPEDQHTSTDESQVDEPEPVQPFHEMPVVHHPEHRDTSTDESRVDDEPVQKRRRSVCLVSLFMLFKLCLVRLFKSVESFHEIHALSWRVQIIFPVMLIAGCMELYLL